MKFTLLWLLFFLNLTFRAFKYEIIKSDYFVFQELKLSDGLLYLQQLNKIQ